MTDLAADPAGARLLNSLFGNSPFLSQCCIAEPECLLDVARNGVERTFADDPVLARLGNWGRQPPLMPSCGRCASPAGGSR